LGIPKVGARANARYQAHSERKPYNRQVHSKRDLITIIFDYTAR